MLPLLALAAGVVPGVAAAQAWRPPIRRDSVSQRPVNPAVQHYLARRAALAAKRIDRRMPSVVVGEAEPNNSPFAATVVALFDTVSGTISPGDDIDYFAVDLTAGTMLDLDIDAAAIGSPLDPVIGLFDTDGETLLTFNDDSEGPDSRILYVIPADGRYYAAVVGSNGGGGPSYVYAMAFGVFVPDESEPNNSAAEANVVALGDGVIGVIDPATDVDYFAIDLTDRALLEVGLSAPFFASLAVYGTDGTTLLDSDQFSGSPQWVRAYVPAAGRYYVAVSPLPGSGGQRGPYRFVSDTIATGPGDPTTLFATGFLIPTALAFDQEGMLYVSDAFAQEIVRVGPDGTVSPFVTNIAAYGLALDGFGNLLATGFDLNTGTVGIFRFTPAGDRTTFASQDLYPVGAITAGPDGDVWVVDCGSICYQLVRFDPFGTRKAAMTLPPGVPGGIAFSPAGTLHVTMDSIVYRVDGQSASAAVTTELYLEGLAFDEDGYLYVANGFLGKVLLFDPTYQVMNDPFAATHLGGPISLAFGRDNTGAMTGQLLAANMGYNLHPPYAGGIVVLNPDGIRAPGMRVGVDLIRVASGVLIAGTVGAEYADTLVLADDVNAPIWSVADGALPPGLALDSATGVVSGVPETAGTYSFTARVDGDGRLGIGAFVLEVVEPIVTVTSAVDAALGVPGVLTPELERYFDLQGNQNGVFDIGDVRAFLRRQGQLPAIGSAAATRGGNER
ncbi:MAG TPA: DVUA0089 family protein [Gemmatimonadales bacterium]